MKMNRKLKRIFSTYNIAIFVCIALITISLFIIFKPNKKYTTEGIEIIQTGTEENEEISEENARKATIKQFKKLGENVKEEDLKVTKISRSNIEYYYITSAKNSLEIRIKGGIIERINSVLIEF